MYADDTQLYNSFHIEHYQQALLNINNDLNNIANVSQKHSLQINPLKSVILLFGSNNVLSELENRINLSINNTPIPVRAEARNLGLFMDNSFRYKTQLSNYIKQAYINLKLIYPHRKYLPTKIKSMLCETLVLSHFSFCSQVYGPSITADTVRRVQRVQNSCLRLVYGVRKFDHISHKLKESNWLSMQNRRTLQAACLYHKIITERRPPYLMQKISFRTDIHNLNLRYKGAITPPLHRTSLFESGFSYQISKVYNHIPLDIKNSSVKVFKSKFRQFLLNSQNFR